jgi:hypothetical protein
MVDFSRVNVMGMQCRPCGLTFSDNVPIDDQGVAIVVCPKCLSSFRFLIKKEHFQNPDVTHRYLETDVITTKHEETNKETGS